jgi:hypothetical protein
MVNGQGQRLGRPAPANCSTGRTTLMNDGMTQLLREADKLAAQLREGT